MPASRLEVELGGHGDERGVDALGLPHGRVTCISLTES